MVTRYPARRRRLVRSSPRRQVEIARLSFGNTALGVSTLTQNLLGDWSSDAGLVNNPAGITVAGIKYRLFLGGATVAVTSIRVTWGIQVNSVDIEGDDINPDTRQHLDWMEWGVFQGGFAANEWKAVHGNGDEGFRSVRSKRKVNGLEQNLLLCINASSSPTNFGFHIAASTALLMP